MTTRKGLGLLVALTAAACTRSGPASSPGGSARISVALSSAAVSRMTVTIGPGDGPTFDPIVADLQGSGSAWGAHVTGIPVGPGRLFTVTAYDSQGAVVETGSARCDVVAGASALVEIQLGGSAPPPWENSAPVIDHLGASSTRVGPGLPVTVRVSAHDPDPGDTVSYLWEASCGTFDQPTLPAAVWTAPATAPMTCQLSITVGDGRGASVTIPFDVLVSAGRVVSGTRLVTYWPDPPAAKVTVPAPDTLSAAAPFALERDGAGNWFTHPGGHFQAGGSFVAGGFGADGSFAIPDAPGGRYTLCYALGDGVQACGDTAQDQVDLGYDLLGRPDQSFAAAPTPVTLALSGLDAWNPTTDSVQLTSSGANLWDELVPRFRGGATAGESVEDWFDPGVGAPLGLLAAGDTLFVHQLSTRSFYLDGALVLYTAATRATPALTGISIVDGQAGAISAALAPLPLSASLAVDWNLPEFEKHLSAMGPAARTTPGARPHLLVVDASAHGLEVPAPTPSTESPELIVLELPAGLHPVSTTLYYGRFLPASWQETRRVGYSAQVSYLAPGATLPVSETASVERRDPIAAPAGSIAPLVSPVLAPRLNGQDALLDGSAPATTTPTLSWSAPASGSPTGYMVDVFRLRAQGQATLSSRVLRYVTSELQVTVPPGVLEAGGTYYARITARVTAVSPDTGPFRWATSGGEASTFTGTFVP